MNFYDALVTTAARIAELESDLAILRQSRRTIMTGGQAYNAEGRMLTRADLKTLNETEVTMEAQLRRLKRGSGPKLFGAVYK